MMNTEFTQRQLNMETIRRLAKTLQRWEIEQIVNDLKDRFEKVLHIMSPK